MRIFIKMLVYSLRTIDGHKGSANKILDTLHQQDIKDFQDFTKRKQINESKKHEFIHRNEYRIFKKVCFKYKVLQFRMKMSFIAFKKGISVVELLLNAIQFSYKSLTKAGLIKPYNNRKKSERYLYK